MLKNNGTEVEEECEFALARRHLLEQLTAQEVEERDLAVRAICKKPPRVHAQYA